MNKLHCWGQFTGDGMSRRYIARDLVWVFVSFASMRILMVCLGNICRSPIAEGVLRHKVKQHGLNWVVDSAGTESYHVGEPPHRFSQKICMDHGISIGEQRARKFMAEDFAGYDKIYAMAGDVYREIKEIGGPHADMSKVDYFLNELYHEYHISHDKMISALIGHTMKKNESVPDPFYGWEDGYKVVYEMVDRTCESIIKRYKNDIYV